MKDKKTTKKESFNDRTRQQPAPARKAAGMIQMYTRKRNELPKLHRLPNSQQFFNKRTNQPEDGGFISPKGKKPKPKRISSARNVSTSHTQKKKRDHDNRKFCSLLFPIQKQSTLLNHLPNLHHKTPRISPDFLRRRHTLLRIPTPIHDLVDDLPEQIFAHHHRTGGFGV